jgi:hypothetical protein
MKWHKSHTRKILDKRPRKARAHRGTEFQLPSEYLEFIDTFGELVEAPNRSVALMRIIDLAKMDALDLLSLVLDSIAERHPAWVGRHLSNARNEND